MAASKADRLRVVSTSDGIIAALAIDQRKSLRRMIAGASGLPVDSIPDSQLSEFKTTVARYLAPHASAVLLDPEYGLDARLAKSPACGLLLAYEMDGYENPRPHRMLALLPELSVRRLRDLGADGIKVLLSYSPFDDPRANEAKHAMIERIGCECESVGLPFFLEPVCYDPGGLDTTGPEFARIKPEIVARSMKEFSKDIYKVDILKVEFPVNVNFIGSVYSRAEALQIFRRADEAARRPYIYLSAGVDIDSFTQSLQLAAEAGARYSGVLCGRAIWQGGATAYAAGGVEQLERWLASTGVPNILAVNACLKTAQPWHSLT